jgi:hypothetical protein
MGGVQLEKKHLKWNDECHLWTCVQLEIFLYLDHIENDVFPCNNKSILMSTLLFFGINVCMESNKINLKLY